MSDNLSATGDVNETFQSTPSMSGDYGALGTMVGGMPFNVSFGSAFSVDQFGFIRKGTITIEPEQVVFSGKKHWSALARIGIFLGITVLPLILFGVGLGFILALIIIHFFCASAGSLSIQKRSITDVERKGRQVKFRGHHPESGATKKTVFKVDTEENAMILENTLKAGLRTGSLS